MRGQGEAGKSQALQMGSTGDWVERETNLGLSTLYHSWHCQNRTAQQGVHDEFEKGIYCRDLAVSMASTPVMAQQGSAALCR
jgi:hypothetical protein